ncbi:palmitoyltransferase ZDHHC23-like [Limulus polyphemus]|uniref:Palmitoyltransferase n=1 Tax=Limulus polyphemus TaxID=6850 RepID=A0ABM1BL97_LIMPO|nr:palmitoyltransferase ZDHHC23-like [Limulus polyphemus]
MALCCDCEALDEAFERFITCKPVQPNTCSRIMETITDHLRVPWCDGQGARKLDPDILMAAVLLLTTMFIASQSWTATIVVFGLLPFLLIATYIRYLKIRTQTKFFFAWTVLSFSFLLGIFQFEVVPYLEILFSENFILMCFVAIMCLCGYLTKQGPGQPPNGEVSDQEEGAIKDAVNLVIEDQKTKCRVCSIHQPHRCSHCRICNQCVLRRDHHCVWLDCCIGAKNHRYFIIGLVALIIVCCYGANLTLTTICQPKLVWGTVYLPDSCNDVYGDIHIAMCFVSAVYALLIAALAVLALGQQLWFICCNTTVQEWRRGRQGHYSHGILCNCWKFWCGGNL